VSKNLLRVRSEILIRSVQFAQSCASRTCQSTGNRWENAVGVDKIKTSSGRVIWKFVDIMIDYRKLTLLKLILVFAYIFFFLTTNYQRGIGNSRAKLRQSSSLYIDASIKCISRKIVSNVSHFRHVSANLILRIDRLQTAHRGQFA